MNAVRPPSFTLGPYFPCAFKDDHCGADVRSVAAIEIAAATAPAVFQVNANGEYPSEAEIAKWADQVMHVTDAVCGRLEWTP
jgi:hypothetical protein